MRSRMFISLFVNTVCMTYVHVTYEYMNENVEYCIILFYSLILQYLKDFAVE